MVKPKSTSSKAGEKIVYVTTLSGNSHAVRFKDVSRAHPALKDYFCYCIFKVANRMKASVDEALTSERIQTVHLAILTILNHETIAQNQLAEQMGIDKASMVKLIDHLEKLKFVERIGDTQDRRIKFLHLTASGKSVFEKAKTLVKKAEKEFFKGISEKDRESLREILPRLISS